MSKCVKCAYYNPVYEKCHNFGNYVECKENCNRYKRNAWPYSEKELETFSDEDLIELYQANYNYALGWEDGEADMDYVFPPKRELEKRGYKVDGYEVIKNVKKD